MEEQFILSRTQPDAHEAAQESVKPGGGEEDGFSWQDQDEEVEITVAVGSIKRSDVKLAFKAKEVRMDAPKTFRMELYAAVDPDGCNWTLSGANLVLTLEKKDVPPTPVLSHRQKGNTSVLNTFKHLQALYNMYTGS